MSAIGVEKICFLKRSINAVDYQDVQDYFLTPYIENELSIGYWLYGNQT